MFVWLGSLAFLIWSSINFCLLQKTQPELEEILEWRARFKSEPRNAAYDFCHQESKAVTKNVPFFYCKTEISRGKQKTPICSRPFFRNYKNIFYHIGRKCFVIFKKMRKKIFELELTIKA